MVKVEVSLCINTPLDIRGRPSAVLRLIAIAIDLPITTYDRKKPSVKSGNMRCIHIYWLHSARGVHRLRILCRMGQHNHIWACHIVVLFLVQSVSGISAVISQNFVRDVSYQCVTYRVQPLDMCFTWSKFYITGTGRDIVGVITCGYYYPNYIWKFMNITTHQQTFSPGNNILESSQNGHCHTDIPTTFSNEFYWPCILIRISWKFVFESPISGKSSPQQITTDIADLSELTSYTRGFRNHATRWWFQMIQQRPVSWSAWVMGYGL